MATNSQFNRTFTAFGSPDPQLILIRICSRGMVFHTQDQYDIGTRLAVGMHLKKIRGDLGMGKCEHGCSINGDHYLNLRGMAVDCRIVEAAKNKVVFEVTVLFDNLGAEDRRVLRTIEAEREARACLSAREKAVVMGLN
jgi:hypothetical protein